MSAMSQSRPAGSRARLHAIRPILPVLAAEAALWLGFGALLPILPLYLTEQGVDSVTLGLIVAAWPATRLIGEPAFGWLADRHDRRVLMLGGLLATAVVVPLPLVLTGAPAFLVLRGLAGLGTAAYDPAARGYILDAVPVDERGHAFGLYSSAQMGGFLLGPAVGGIGAALFGGYGFPFVFCGVALVVAAALLAAGTRRPTCGVSGAGEARLSADPAPAGPASLANRILVAAMLVNLGTYFASGTYEVIWSLWMRDIGADLGLIGLSFAAFGLAVLVLSPFAGRLIDRSGPVRFVVLGVLAVALAGLVYPALAQPWAVIPVVMVEGAGFALAGPALYTLVGRGTPAGRSSTAQGIYGAAGTIGFIAASLVAGALFAIDHRLPFYVFVVGLLATAGGGLLVGGRAMAEPDASLAGPVDGAGVGAGSPARSAGPATAGD